MILVIAKVLECVQMHESELPNIITPDRSHGNINKLFERNFIFFENSDIQTEGFPKSLEVTF